LAKAVLPLVLLFILSACGGSAKVDRSPTEGVRGDGFTVLVPQSWHVTRPREAVVARSGGYLVSVTTFKLEKAYDPGRFGAVTKELDGVVEKLAGQAGAKVTERMTTTVDGRKIRAYRYTGGGGSMRIGFVLDGTREYQLFCRLPAEATDPAAGCALLFDSFKIS